MRTMKRMAALLLALMLVLSWFPAASAFTFATPAQISYLAYPDRIC